MKYSNSKISTILFDLDGTLIDSIPDITQALNNMRKKFSLPPIKADAVRNIVGRGFPTTVKKILSIDNSEQEVETIYKEAYQITLTEYTQHMGKHTTIFPNVIDTLIDLKKQNYRTAIVTNKESKHAILTIKHLNLEPYFDLIIGGNTTNNYKPHPEPVYFAMKKLQASPENSIMIGDSKSDIQAAKAANIRSIAVTYGYNHGEPINNAQPDYIINNIGELTNLLVNI